MGRGQPAKGVVCSTGTTTGDAGDFYLCSQLSYGSGPGVSTGKNRTWWKEDDSHLATWSLQLGYMGLASRRQSHFAA